MKRKKIVLFVNNLAVGGTQKNVLTIARALDRTRFEAEICLSSSTIMFHESIIKEIPSLKVIPWFSYKTGHRGTQKDSKRFHPVVFIKFMYYLFKNRNATWHFFGFPLIYFGIAASYLTGNRRIVTTIQDWDVWKKSYHRFLDKFVYKRSRRIVCDGNGCSEYAQKAGNASQYADKFRIIYDGVDTAGLGVKGESNLTRAALGLPADVPTAGVIGRYDVRKKGQDDFIKCAALVLKEYPDARFLLVGYGDDEVCLQALATNMGLDNAVVFIAANTDLQSVFDLMDVLVISSRWESVPKILLEGMAAAKPIVSTDAGDTREVMEDRVEGILIRVSDIQGMAGAICEMFGSKHLRGMLGQNAKNKVLEKYTLEKSMTAIEEVYCEVDYEWNGTNKKKA